MQDLPSWLRQYGLNNTEIKVYLCILGHPEAKAVDIQRQTGIVRTTIYNTLAELKSAGLISESKQNNVKSYRAEDIKILRATLENEIFERNERLDQLDELKPLFDKLAIKAPDDASFVSRYEGIEPIKQAIEQAMRCKSKRWHVIAARNNFLYYTTKQYQTYYLNERKRRGIKAKTLWEPAPDFKTEPNEDKLYRNPRKLPKEFFGTIKSLVILYDDTTLIIDPFDEKTAHAVHSATSTHLFRLLHEFAWKNSAAVD